MIYLIDDNQNNQRLKKHQIDFVDKNIFSKYLKSIEKIEKKDDANDISRLLFLNEADCILLHETTEDVDYKGSFIKGSRTNSTKIKERISKEGENIPLVLFSNKMNEKAAYDYETNPNYIYGLKKNKFYERLWDFIQDYKQTGKVELRILAFGKNFIANEIAEYSKELLAPIAIKKNADELVITDIKNLEVFQFFLTKSFPSLNWENVLIDLEDNPITIGDFREKINKITESFFNHGKNIYNWQ